LFDLESICHYYEARDIVVLSLGESQLRTACQRCGAVVRVRVDWPHGWPDNSSATAFERTTFRLNGLL
jgi:hypothetical protein